MLDCREVFATKHSSDPSDAALPAKGRNTTTPFKVALAAAKKKLGGGDQTPGGKSGSKPGEKTGGVSTPVLPKSSASDSHKLQQPVMISGFPKLEML